MTLCNGPKDGRLNDRNYLPFQCINKCINDKLCWRIYICNYCVLIHNGMFSIKTEHSVKQKARTNKVTLIISSSPSLISILRWTMYCAWQEDLTAPERTKFMNTPTDRSTCKSIRYCKFTACWRYSLICHKVYCILKQF